MPTEAKIALITGANKGLGFEVAQQLGKAGMTVLVGARKPDAGEAAVTQLKEQGINAHFIQIDVTQRDSVQQAAKKILQDFQRLDVLVNNAGIIDQQDGLPSEVHLEAMHRIFETNFFGAVAVTQAMLPLVKHSAEGRIVNVSSGLGSLTLHSQPDWEYSKIKVLGYCASKSALNMMTVQLAYELRDTHIKVNSADPGYTATDLNGNRGTQTVAEGAEIIVKLALLPAEGPSGGFFDRHGTNPW